MKNLFPFSFIGYLVLIILLFSSDFSYCQDAKSIKQDSTKTGLFHKNPAEKEQKKEAKEAKKQEQDSIKVEKQQLKELAVDSNEIKQPKDTTKTGLFHKNKNQSDSTKTGLSHHEQNSEDSTSTKKTDSDKNHRGFLSKNDNPDNSISVANDGSLIEPDTIHQERENSPLDISNDRGIYIIANNGFLQMRILGSVRFSAFYDFRNLESTNSFNTYEIPTGDDNFKLPNYYNSLNFSRLGFEVTRRTSKYDFFIRLEMDFAGVNNSFRIRHAYGSYGRFLVGQTWSLLCNVEALPATVDPFGPVSSIQVRTPQLRLNHRFTENLNAAIALEYSLPDYIPEDSINIRFVQTIPNITFRFSKKGTFGSVQLAGILAPITGVEEGGSKNTSLGYGLSVSGLFNLKASDEILYQFTLGESISHFLNPFSGSGQDMAYDPDTQTFKGVGTLGGWVSYGHHWPKKISSYFSFGIAPLLNRSFELGSDYDFSYDFSFNGFWTISDGLRVGIEFLVGQRYDIDGANGSASRIWALFYYDF